MTRNCGYGVFQGYNDSGCVLPLFLFYSDASVDEVEERDRCDTSRTLRPVVSLYCSALSLARSAQAERDNESCFFDQTPYLLSSVKTTVLRCPSLAMCTRGDNPSSSHCGIKGYTGPLPLYVDLNN
ncbi:hypothetical protein EVAR_47635_1 [Eumeta japonica]|uniref:Uncharacterized protein n=1 Tax=Eumeta variegata TaxID=151549 RepID=A0A4C1ZE19_EUMVA|nr:hypothetical protein EVAR_47635_1 [Eumeta japonica]